MKYFFILFLLVVSFSCTDKKGTQVNEDATIKTITSIDDYKKYVEYDQTVVIQKIDSEIDSLKSVLIERPSNVLDLSKVAGLLDQRFDVLSNVEDLNASVRFRESVVKNTAIKPENALRALAQSYIKQHRFQDADSVMQSFTKEYSSKASKYVLFDVAMELGIYKEAEMLLNALRNESDYNYLIRSAKWNDHIGRLDNTILAMEKALQLAEKSGRDSWKLWSYSNIADYYGHDGQIEKSYEHYLKTLQLDPGNSYALKGISWIAYSHDRNIPAALHILKDIHERHPAPDYLLSIAEIQEYLGKTDLANRLKKEFVSLVHRPEYGAMYNAYLIEELAGGNDEEQKKALDLARLEIRNRATPETYDLLAYALLKNGDHKEALAIHKKHVENQTHEPVALMHKAMIYVANDQKKHTENLKKELKEAHYELGPVVMEKITML